MESQRTKREWLQWLARVRLMMIVLILAAAALIKYLRTGGKEGRQ